MQGSWRKQINLAQQSIENIRQILPTLNKESEHYKQIEQLLLKCATAEEKFKTSMQRSNDPMTEAKKLYTDLANAQKQYEQAKTPQAKQYWAEQVTILQSAVEYGLQNLGNLGLEESKRKEIEGILLRCLGLIKEFNSQNSKGAQLLTNMSSTFDMLWSKIRLIAGLSLFKIFRDALTYAKDFDKALTDIAIVTQQPLENVREMGKEYRNMANDLGVTSTSVAEAAAKI